MAQSIIQAGPYVFLSYLSSERGKVLLIARELEKIGVRVWIDLISIPAGGNYGLAIAEGIENCAAVLIACSPAALQSRNVKQEIQLAWKHQRPYLPLLLEPTTFPQDIEYWLEGYQWVEILDHPTEVWLPRLVHALKKLGVPSNYAAIREAEAEVGGSPNMDPIELEIELEGQSPPAQRAPTLASPIKPAVAQPAQTKGASGPLVPSRAKFLVAVATLAIVFLALGVVLAVSWRAGTQVSNAPPAGIAQPAAGTGGGSASLPTVPSVTGSGVQAPPPVGGPPTAVPAATSGRAPASASPPSSAPVMPMGS